jgi:hypothetical protein
MMIYFVSWASKIRRQSVPRRQVPKIQPGHAYGTQALSNKAMFATFKKIAT